jgi:hypothetical protein
MSAVAPLSHQPRTENSKSGVVQTQVLRQGSKALIVKCAVFVFSLFLAQESADVPSIGSQRKSILGIEPRATDEVARADPGPRQIALSFDAGDGVDALPELLAALRDASVNLRFSSPVNGRSGIRITQNRPWQMGTRSEITAGAIPELTTLSDAIYLGRSSVLTQRSLPTRYQRREPIFHLMLNQHKMATRP